MKGAGDIYRKPKKALIVLKMKFYYPNRPLGVIFMLWNFFHFLLKILTLFSRNSIFHKFLPKGTVNFFDPDRFGPSKTYPKLIYKSLCWYILLCLITSQIWCGPLYLLLPRTPSTNIPQRSERTNVCVITTGAMPCTHLGMLNVYISMFFF